MSRKTEKRRDFSSSVVFRDGRFCFGKKLKGGRNFCLRWWGIFGFGRSFGQKVFPDQFCKISQHFSAFSSGCSLKKGGEIIDFHKRWGLFAFLQSMGFLLLGKHSSSE